MTSTATHIAQRWQDSILPTLHDYIRIPNKSPNFDPDWEANGYMAQAAEMLLAWTSTVTIKDMQAEIVTLPGRTPLIYCEIPATNGSNAATDPCVLLYGHYDKQPEFEGWEPGLSPWTPVERDGKLYGRGGADDGYALFSCLTAIEAMQQADQPHPRCAVIIEGCEESGSFDLPHYMDLLRERIGHTRLVICLDAECANYDQLWVTTSLRGMIRGTLSVDILTEGQHSGLAGGIVPSSFRILRHLIERVENAATGELHSALQVDIPSHIQDAAHAMAQVTGPEFVQRLPWVSGAGVDNEDVADLLLASTWRPSMATVGLAGAPGIKDAGNILRPNTTAKLVFRLPPTLDAGPAAQQVKTLLEADPPYGARVVFDIDTPHGGWAAPAESPWLAKALNDASQHYFNKPVMHMGCGGTIPFMKMLGDAYPDTEFFVTGVLGPKSNAHGPNEFLHIDTARRVTGCVSDVLAAASTAFCTSPDQ
ncbi:MAG: M20/M25/M40 family metallo-hydrolase [bacterium]